MHPSASWNTARRHPLNLPPPEFPVLPALLVNSSTTKISSHFVPQAYNLLSSSFFNFTAKKIMYLHTYTFIASIVATTLSRERYWCSGGDEESGGKGPADRQLATSALNLPPPKFPVLPALLVNSSTTKISSHFVPQAYNLLSSSFFNFTAKKIIYLHTYTFIASIVATTLSRERYWCSGGDEESGGKDRQLATSALNLLPPEILPVLTFLFSLSSTLLANFCGCTDKYRAKVSKVSALERVDSVLWSSFKLTDRVAFVACKFNNSSNGALPQTVLTKVYSLWKENMKRSSENFCTTDRSISPIRYLGSLFPNPNYSTRTTRRQYSLNIRKDPLHLGRVSGQIPRQ